MYHYDPATALEELQEDALLPNPVHIRDMIVRARLKPDQALELNRKFQTYLEAFGDAQEIAKLILQQLATAG
ncbi:MAG TPA: hypothetical protein VGP62_14115 [Bryobacteraceae bacterium]|jgi:hypothetical protein|nr:hypothetical protein [Bryobacteraceae bacterium]